MLGFLRKDRFPETAQNVTAFVGINKEQNKQTIISGNHKDRRKKVDTLSMKLLPNCDEVDIMQYVLQLTMQFGEDKFYVGTGTIFKIIQNTLYILTCAHNVITFHPYKNQKYHAQNIWIKFQNTEYPASKFYIYPKYTKKYRLGNDLAVIECEIHESFMFYHIFPTFKSLEHDINDGQEWEIQQSQQQNMKLNIGQNATSISMWMVTSMTNAAYNAMKTSFGENEEDDDETKEDMMKNRIKQKQMGMNMDDDDMAGFKGEVYGYPGEKNGECWGMDGNVNVLANENLISYDNIDTTGGQVVQQYGLMDVLLVFIQMVIIWE